MDFHHEYDPGLAKQYAGNMLETRAASLTLGSDDPRSWRTFDAENMSLIGRPSAEKMNYDDRPDMHVFRGEVERIGYTFIVFTRSEAGETTFELLNEGQPADDQEEVARQFSNYLGKLRLSIERPSRISSMEF